MNVIRMLFAASAVFCLAGALHAAPVPWVLAKDDDGQSDSPVKQYVKNLGKEPREAVIALDKQLRERIAEDRKIIASNGPGKAAAQKEIERYESFLDELGDPLRFCFNGKIDIVKKSMRFDSYRVPVYRRTTMVMRNPQDKKYYFIGANGEPEFLRGKDLELAKEDIQRMGYISHFCGKQQPDPRQVYMQISSKAAICCISGRQALANNSIKVVRFHPMPAKGALHDALAKDALACIRTRLPKTEAIVIGDNDWYIQRNRLGIIICRICCGWAIVRDDIGKRAIPVKWSQPNQGGSSYGRLQLRNFGGNKTFYIK